MTTPPAVALGARPVYWNPWPSPAIVLCMRGFFGRPFVWLLALSFAASGVAAGQCAAAHWSSADIGGARYLQIDPGHHEHSAERAAHGPQDHGTAGHQHESNDFVPTAHDDHGCDKCCGICTLVGAMVAEVGDTAIFTASSACYFHKSDFCSDTTIRVDPGIPKRMV